MSVFLFFVVVLNRLFKIGQNDLSDIRLKRSPLMRAFLFTANVCASIIFLKEHHYEK